MIKTFSKVGIKGAFLHIIKDIGETYSQHHTQWAKTKSFLTEIRNKTRMSAFITSIEHSIGSPSHSNQTTKIKCLQIGKEETKLSLFADDMLVYRENPIDSPPKLLNLIGELGKIGGYKVNIQKLKAFLYNNEIAETENRGKNPFDNSNKKIKYLGINLMKEVKHLYSENYTTLKKEIKEDTNKWIMCPFMYWKN
ncbi:hypothetical protein HJG60_009291 [Phyllostomus discolor]|uniref:Reverse transcriptase domain-containing protein n=1 Tax=Phyllostomus discolor TaxID=89673 RepID=A0A833YIT7_9CHIR|nr:hypothetical protein HJG60_009291 [Phyllostomus discolor]